MKHKLFKAQHLAFILNLRQFLVTIHLISLNMLKLILACLDFSRLEDIVVVFTWLKFIFIRNHHVFLLLILLFQWLTFKNSHGDSAIHKLFVPFSIQRLF